MIKAILVDDEPNNTQYVKELLLQHFPAVEITAICNDAAEGMLLIDELQPQLVFMDVEMPGLNGFDVLQKLEPVSFEVIFITAYDHYAVQAFDVHATGYLTKPIVVEKFIKVTAAAIQKIEKDDINRNLFSMLKNNGTKETPDKIALPTQTGFHFVQSNDIIYLESNGNYTQFYLQNKRKITVSRQIGEYEKLLPADIFVRTHDKYIINIECLAEYMRGNGGDIKLQNGVVLPVSMRRKDNLLLRFEKWMKRK